MATTDHFPATHNETSSFPTPSASRFTRIARFFFVNIIILAVICFTIFVSIILASGEDDTSARLNDNLYHLKDQSRMLLPQRIDKLRVRIFSWNLGNSHGYKDITLKSLGLAKYFDQPINDLPHIIICGFQETSTMPIGSNPVAIHLSNLLGKEQFGYYKIASQRLGGMLLLVFGHTDVLTLVREIETSWVPTGFLNLYGNKGGVAVRFSMAHEHLNFAVVNAHLAAHDEKLDQRIADYNSILDRMTFKNSKFPNVLSHNEIFFFGDLNFRINQLTAEEILYEITQGGETNRRNLLINDQLKKVQSENRAFTCLNEPKIEFWPTFKFKVGQEDVYDLKRKPAYTDRILFKGITQHGVASRNDQPVEKSGTTVIEYKSISSFVASDHKPVTALFSVDPSFKTERSADETDEIMFRVRGPLSDAQGVGFGGVFVFFEGLPNWKNDTDNLVAFALHDFDGNFLSSNLVNSFDRTWDWVGVYPANFTDVDNWICYSYAQYATVKDATPEIPHTHLVLKMDCLLPVGGTYKLVYFHEEESRSILGVSDPFVVTE